MELAEFVATAEVETEEIDTSGWSDLGGQARKFHFFPNNEGDTRSLRGKWVIWRSHKLQKGEFDNSMNCATCTRKLKA